MTTGPSAEPFVSAITLVVRRRSDTASTSTSTRSPSERPAAAPSDSTGISIPGAPSVALGGSSLSPSTTSSAAAPAASA
jgi:hypothetical protein